MTKKLNKKCKKFHRRHLSNWIICILIPHQVVHALGVAQQGPLVRVQARNHVLVKQLSWFFLIGRRRTVLFRTTPWTWFTRRHARFFISSTFLDDSFINIFFFRFQTNEYCSYSVLWYFMGIYGNYINKRS